MTSRRSTRLVAVCAVAVLALAGCGSSEESSTAVGDQDRSSAAPQDEDAAEDKEADKANWEYKGAEGPENWGQLDAAYAVCESGAEQSPIDLDPATATSADLPDPEISWTPGPVTMINNGHTIQANVAPGNSSMLGGESYDLLQFHWHKPSENTVGKDPFAMELHFVHANADDELAVLGVLIEEGAANPAYDELWSAQPAEGEEKVVEGLDFSTLLPSTLTTYVFPGSLTTPPCSEGVSWNLLTDPAEMSAEQLGEFLYDGNARPVQEINERTITVDQD